MLLFTNLFGGQAGNKFLSFSSLAVKIIHPLNHQCKTLRPHLQRT